MINNDAWRDVFARARAAADDPDQRSVVRRFSSMPESRIFHDELSVAARKARVNMCLVLIGRLEVVLGFGDFGKATPSFIDDFAESLLPMN